jgi:hypothetical protein
MSVGGSGGIILLEDLNDLSDFLDIQGTVVSPLQWIEELAVKAEDERWRQERENLF